MNENKQNTKMVLQIERSKTKQQKEKKEKNKVDHLTSIEFLYLTLPLSFYSNPKR